MSDNNLTPEPIAADRLDKIIDELGRLLSRQGDDIASLWRDSFSIAVELRNRRVSSETPESCNVERTGVYVNTGYSHTASGHIVRDGNYWVATFKLGSEADNYVAHMNNQSVPTEECQNCLELIKERDDIVDMCDKLAEAISKLTGVYIGEHSSANFPWDNALEAIENYDPLTSVPPTNALIAAAQAVVDRWDTPLWKDAPATATYINALRNALSAEPIKSRAQEIMEANDPLNARDIYGTKTIHGAQPDGPRKRYCEHGYNVSEMADGSVVCEKCSARGFIVVAETGGSQS